MANATICTNDLITASGVTFTSSTEVSGYPAENVQIYQPGESFRTSVVDLGWLQADFGPVKGFDEVGVLYTNGTAHRNLLKQSNTLNTSPWTKTNVSVTEGSEASIPVGGLGQTCVITDDATSAEHKVVQTWTAPGSGGLTHTPMTVGALVAGLSITKCRLKIEDNSGNNARVDFDLSAGTATSVTTGGGSPFTAGSATITAVSSAVGSSDWYEVALTATPGSAVATTYTMTIYLMVGGAISYSGSSEILLVNGSTFELGSSKSNPFATTTDTGALIRIKDSAGTISGSEWGHLVGEDLTDQDFVHWVLKYSTTIYADQPTVWIFDPDNADGYFEIGNYVVAKSFQPSKNIGSDWHITWAEDGSSSRTPGGQLFRPVNKRYRLGHMAHTWLTESEAWGEAYEIDRKAGRSEGVLVSINPDGTYANKQTLWGLQQDIGGVVHRTYSKSEGGLVFAKEWNFAEALP